MKKTTLKILDEVNVKFSDLDPLTRRNMVEKLEFFNPKARHTASFKLGHWDGKVGFCTVGGGTYLNLLDRVLPIVIGAGYEVEIDDQRKPFNNLLTPIDKNYFAHINWPKGHQIAGQPIILNDHQVTAINTYVANPQSIQSISTGAGKTSICAVLSSMCEKMGRTIVIVPSKSLVVQTEAEYINVGLSVGVLYGDRKEVNAKHVICTWQSLAAISKKLKLGDKPSVDVEMLMKDLVAVITDEAHGARGAILKDLLLNSFASVACRWAMTGTIPPLEFEQITLLAAIGPVVGEIKAKELQDLGILANCNINVLQLNDKVAKFDSYFEESSYLLKNKTRLAWIAKFCTELSASGNTVILVDKIDTGKYLNAMIPNSVFLSGKSTVNKRLEEYSKVNTSDNKLIIATYGIAAVGINIPRINHLVGIEMGVSAIRVVQSIGRGLRIAEDKDSVEIYDICSTLKYSAKHLSKRKAMYKIAEYPFTVQKIDI